MSDLSATIHEWHLRNHRYIAYVRAADQFDIDEQYQEIEKYAKEHHLNVVEIFCDLGDARSGLHQALKSMEETDGMIICNLNRLVKHHDDRLRELRPMLHKFCSPHEGKHLISIEEGINTGTPLGQMNALELINELRDVV